MSLTTVASLEAYTSDTSQPSPDNYAEFSQQERVSVNLIDNNLWLVDSSQLNAQTISEPPVTLVDWTTKDQTNVSLDNITAVASPIGIPTTAVSGESNLLPSINLSEGTLLQLPQITGSLQLDSATTPTSSGRSSGDLSTGMSGTSTTDRSFSGDGGSNTSIGTPFSSQTTPDTPDSSTASPPNQELPPEGFVPTPVPTPVETMPGTPASPPTSTTTSTEIPLSPAPTPAVPVPFDVSSSLGLIIVLGFLGSKRLIKDYVIGRWFRRFQQYLN